jgi:hypothetical protein
MEARAAARPEAPPDCPLYPRLLTFRLAGYALLGQSLLLAQSGRLRLAGQCRLLDPKRTLLVYQSERFSYAPLCEPNLVQSFPASRFAFPVLGEQLP